MLRYHKKVYIPIEDIKKLQDFTCNLNGITWQYSAHAIDNLKYRAYNIKDILIYIKDLQLDYKDIFEYYKDNGNIQKAVYRVDYKGLYDLCLVISDNKMLVTIYINVKNDNHDTLDKNLYVKVKKS